MLVLIQAKLKERDTYNQITLYKIVKNNHVKLTIRFYTLYCELCFVFLFSSIWLFRSQLFTFKILRVLYAKKPQSFPRQIENTLSMLSVVHFVLFSNLFNICNCVALNCFPPIYFVLYMWKSCKAFLFWRKLERNILKASPFGVVLL